MIYVDYHVLVPLQSPAADERAAYYGGSGTPRTWFNGGDRVIGGTTSTASIYREIVERLADDVSQLSIEASVMMNTTGSSISASVRIDLEIGEDETILLPEECRVRAVLMEDKVSAIGEIFDRIARQLVIDVELPVSTSGETTSLIRDVLIDEAWKVSDLLVIVWVQRDSDQSVLNSVQTRLSDPNPTLQSVAPVRPSRAKADRFPHAAP